MVNYSCPRCGYTINIKKKYENHLRRKKLCENIVSDDNLENEYLKYNISEKLEKNHFIESQSKVNQKSIICQSESIKSQSKVNQKSIKSQPKIIQNSLKKYICEFCDREMSHKQSYYMHLKRCKIKKEYEIERDNERTEMTKIVELLNEQLKDKDKKIDELIKKSGNMTINYQQNNVNNIKLLGYRKTDISHLSDKDFISCMSHSNFCIPHLIKKIHFDPDKPENHNIYISNIKNNYAMIYDGDKWNLTNKDDLINEILEEKEIIIEEKLEEWVEKGKQYPEIMKKFTRYLEKKENDAVLDKIKDEVKLVLFNNRTIIKNQ